MLTLPAAASAISRLHWLQIGPPPLLYALPNQLRLLLASAVSVSVPVLNEIATFCGMSLRRRVCVELTTISLSSASWSPITSVCATCAGVNATVASLSL